MLLRVLLFLSLFPFALAGGAHAQTVPSEIKIGSLYASSGPFASISMPVYYTLKLWVDRTNAAGGVFVKPYNKKIPIKLISYDDQSSTATAATLYNQLITQDKVDLLVADSGSVLTSVAVPIAKEHKMFLFDVSGTGGTFFTKDNPYIALMADPVSTIWPKYLADFLNSTGVAEGIKTVAILYSTNDFTTTQANAVRGFIKNAGKLEIVYDQGVPTTTSNYTVLINNIAATNPDAVLHLGYAGNDIAFFRNLQDSGQKFRFVFGIYPGEEQDELTKTVGVTGLTDIFTYVPPSAYDYKPNFGTDARAVPCHVGQRAPARRRVRRQRCLWLHDRTGHRACARHHREPGPDGNPQCGVWPVRQIDNARRHLCVGRYGRAGGRDHATRPVAGGRQGRPEPGRRLPTRTDQRQADLRQVIAPFGIR